MKLLKRYYGLFLISVGLSIPINGSFSATVPVSQWQPLAFKFSQAAQNFAWRNKYLIGAGLGLLAAGGLGVRGIKHYNLKKEQETERKKRLAAFINREDEDIEKRKRLEDPQVANKVAFESFINQRNFEEQKEILAEEQKERRVIEQEQESILNLKAMSDLILDESRKRMGLELVQRIEHYRRFEGYQNYISVFKHFIKPNQEIFHTFFQDFIKDKKDLGLENTETYSVGAPDVIVVKRNQDIREQDLTNSDFSKLLFFMHPNSYASIDIYKVDTTDNSFASLTPLAPGYYITKFLTYEDFSLQEYYDYYHDAPYNFVTYFGMHNQEFYPKQSPERLFEGLMYSILKHLGDIRSSRALSILKLIEQNQDVLKDKEIVFLADRRDGPRYQADGTINFDTQVGVRKYINSSGEQVYHGCNQAGKLVKFLFEKKLFTKLLERAEKKFTLKEQLKRYIDKSREHFSQQELDHPLVKQLLQEPLK